MTFKSKFKQNKTSFIFSVALHSIFVFALLLIPHLEHKNKSTPVEIVLLEQPETPLEKKETDPTQIVETNANQANLKKDPLAKYLSAKDNVVEKQTVATKADQFKNIQTKNAIPQQQKIAAAKNTAKNSQPPNPLTEKSKAKLFDASFSPYESMNKREDFKNAAKKERAFQKTENNREASTTNDHIEDVDQSLMTQLNTKEYLYYGYYNRIKNQLNQWWQPKVKEKVSKLVSQGRTIASEDNKRTQLIIVLNEQGTLVKVQVLGASGVRDLDDAAVEAFKQAAPFPNPPKGMLEADKTIKIRWDFVVES